MSRPSYYMAFRSAVERLFNSWTGLQLAVEHGMGGHQARDKAIQMIDYVADYCCASKNLDINDITTVLDDIMDEEFETICEDNSTRELAHLLVRYVELCKGNMQEQMLTEVSQLPPCNLWLCKPQVQQMLPIQPHETIHDIEEEDEGDDEPGEGGDEPMEEDVDPGWTVVKTKKKH